MWSHDDEPADEYVNRPVASGLVFVLRNTPVSANQVTVIAMALGLLGAFCLADDRRVLAAACIFFSIVFDCADGQLARARGGGNRLGRILDGLSDYVVGIALHAAMAVYFLTAIPIGFLTEPWMGVAVTLGSALGMALHSIILDFHKQAYLGRIPAPNASPGTLDRLYAGYVRFQKSLAGRRGASPGFIRALGIFGPTLRLWIIAAMAIHPYAALGGLVGDAYLAGLLILSRFL